MTEKRFEEQNLENHLNRIYDTKKGEVVFDEDIIDLLNKLHEEKEVYKHLWEEMSYYFEDGVSLKDLDDKDFRTLQRLAKGLVD